MSALLLNREDLPGQPHEEERTEGDEYPVDVLEGFPAPDRTVPQPRPNRVGRAPSRFAGRSRKGPQVFGTFELWIRHRTSPAGFTAILAVRKV